MEKYDVIIIGAGPGGLSAALYCARATLKTLIIEKAAVGGLITLTSEIENYPGSIEDATGFSLTQRMERQAAGAGALVGTDEIVAIEKTDDVFFLKGGKEYCAKCVIIATGSSPRLLGVKGEIEFRGRGVSYCAVCDAGFFRNKHVAVVGGGDTALQEARYLSRFASKVSVIHRRDVFRASAANSKKIVGNEKIVFIPNTLVEEISGEGKVNTLKLHEKTTGRSYDYDVDGIFIFAGYTPNSTLFQGFAELDTDGYIVTDERMQTNTAGLFAVGDVRKTPLRQVVTAAADGAVAAVEAEKYIFGGF